MGRKNESEAALETLLRALLADKDLVSTQGRVGFLRARAHDSLKEIFGNRLSCEQDYRPAAAALEAGSFSIPGNKSLEGKFSQVLLLPERQKLLTLADLARGMDMLEEGGLLVVSLHNDWGAKRFEKLLAELAGDTGTLSKNHCRVFWARKSSDLNQALLQEWLGYAELVKISGDRFWSRPGLFSWDRIDDGSQFLTEHLPQNIRGTVADLGSGWGFLSDFLLRNRMEIKILEIFEADRVALECSKKNLSKSGGTAKIHFHWTDVTEGVGADKFDFVIMNPPFHEGRRPDTLLGLKFIAAAARALKPDGELWLVANRHLPYEKHMREAFSQTEIVIQQGGYKILRGIRGERFLGHEDSLML